MRPLAGPWAVASMLLPTVLGLQSVARAQAPRLVLASEDGRDGMAWRP